MGSLVFTLLASICATLSSFFFRRNSSSNSNQGPEGYLVFFYTFAFASSILYYPAIWSARVNLIMFFFGGLAGLLSAFLMKLTSKAILIGPSGLTFAFLNAAAIFPGLILFLCFGSDFGFSCTLVQLIGMALVLLGLFFGAKKELGSSKVTMKWLIFSVGVFLVQICTLALIQGRCILFDCNESNWFLFNLTVTHADDIWFMPGMFGFAAIFQIIVFLKKRISLARSEITYGMLGGLANFLSTVFLLLATKYALPLEKGILFPTFAVSTIILCNIWANKFYLEKFNLRTNALCALGIFLAAS